MSLHLCVKFCAPMEAEKKIELPTMGNGVSTMLSCKR